jgi:hypothetical protein
VGAQPDQISSPMPSPLGNARQSADVLGKAELTAGEIGIEFIHDLQPVDAHFHSIRQSVIGSDCIDDEGAAAFAATGITPADVDVAMLYDAFTINTILFLEDLGFCPKGEGGEFVSNGGIVPGGRLAVNTNGGGLSCCHLGIYRLFTLV